MKIKKMLYPMLFQIILYVAQFVVMPMLFYISPYNIIMSFVAIVLSTIFITLIGMIIFSDVIQWWLLGFLVHFILMMLYHPNHIYGIGNGMFDIDIITTVFIALSIMGTQILVWLFIKLFKRIHRELYKNDKE